MSSDLFNENRTNIGSFIDNGAIILWSYHQTLIWALYFYFKKGNIKKKKMSKKTTTKNHKNDLDATGCRLTHF